MDVAETYGQALAEYRAKNYDRALEIIASIEEVVLPWNKLKLLKSRIYRDQKLFVSEIAVLKDVWVDASEKDLMRVVFFDLGVAYRMLGLSAETVKCILVSNEFDDLAKTLSEAISSAIFTANYSDDFDAENFSRLYDMYRNVLSDCKAVPSPPTYNHNRIRIGYLSADFHNHVVMNFAWFMLFGLNRDRFTVYCYSNNKVSDKVTDIIKASIANWRDISKLSDEDAAKQIRADEIDILVDLSGHTAYNRLPIMAYRPARVQISGNGYMNSTGLDCVDYFISDRYCAEDDVAMKKYFTEKIIKLPHTHLCYAPFRNFPDPADAPCLKNGYITFGCFNNFSKVTDTMLSAWQKILRAVPNSRLILKSRVFATDECRNFIAERLRKLGCDISRIEMRGHSKSSDYLADYHMIDIALDTYPYTGVTTTCESLYMGVPVISMYGDHHGKRHSYSLFKNIGIAELAASNIDDYVKLAIGLANDHELLSVLHKNLRGMMKNSPLMNRQEYIRDIENAFTEIYKQG